MSVAFNPPPVRQAWLVLGAQTVQLDNYQAGYFCESLDVGWPTVRAVTTSRPDTDGTIDRTSYFGDRAVTVAIHAVAGAGARLDAVPGLFAPFMGASARPVLHFVLDRPGLPERMITLRPAGFTWPVVGASERQIQLSFVAPDPALYDPNTKTVTAWSGSSVGPGRTYPLTFPRTYPAGGSGGSTATINTPGDLPIKPLVRIYGPITAPQVYFYTGGGGANLGQIMFATGFVLAANQWVDVDCNAKTALLMGDPTQSVVNQLQWWAMIWPVIPPNTNVYLQLSGGSASATTQAQAIWNDKYLT